MEISLSIIYCKNNSSSLLNLILYESVSVNMKISEIKLYSPFVLRMKLNYNLTICFAYLQEPQWLQRNLLVSRALQPHLTLAAQGVIITHFHYNQFHKSNLTTGFLILNGYLLGAGSFKIFTMSAQLFVFRFIGVVKFRN